MSSESQRRPTTDYNPSLRLMKLVKKKNQNFVFEYNTDFIVDFLSLVQNVVFPNGINTEKASLELNNENQHENKIKNFIDSIKTATLNESDFEFIKTIGSGAFGFVQLARCKFNDQVYAIKKQCKLKEVQNTLHNSMRTERDILLKAKHSLWIVKLHFAFQSATHLFLVLDLHTGGDLSQLLLAHGRPFPESLARFYAAETATAVDVLHCLGFLHGDLSPSNLLLDARGHLVLADFGLSLKMDENTGMAVAKNIGTLGYSPPEMFNADEYHSYPRSEAVVGRERDYWSLGVILYEMLYQTLPFWNASEILSCERLLMFPLPQEEKLVVKKSPKVKRKGTFFENRKFQENTIKTCSISQKSTRLSVETKSFIRSLLCRAKQRLGRGQSGFEEIKRHPFFTSVKSSEKPSWSFETLRNVSVRELFPFLEPYLECLKIDERSNNTTDNNSFWFVHHDDHSSCGKKSPDNEQLTFEQSIDFVGFTNSGEFRRKLVRFTTEPVDSPQNAQIQALQGEVQRKDAQIEKLKADLEQWNCQLCRELKLKVENQSRRETFI